MKVHVYQNWVIMTEENPQKRNKRDQFKWFSRKWNQVFPEKRQNRIDPSELIICEPVKNR